MKITKEQVEVFLNEVDGSFPVPLSDKQNLATYAEKLITHATLCCEIVDGKILSMVAGYTKNIPDNMAYVAVVATVPEKKGHGYAKKLVNEFLSICKENDISAAHLYTHKTNKIAIKMYKKIGFIDYKVINEPRPDDVHLIYYTRR